MEGIKFDEANVGTKLAEEYLKKNSVFKSKGFADSDRFTFNDHKNTIYYTNYTRNLGAVVLTKDVSEIPLKLMKLAKKIEENVELFCQLELLLRKIPVEDTERIDLKLMTQNFMYHSSLKCSKEATSTANTISLLCSSDICSRVLPHVFTARQITFDSSTPLLALSFISQVLMGHMPKVVIECTKETAPVATLFIELCHQVGLEGKVLLAILPEVIDGGASKVTMDFKKMREFLNGCVGVVSGKSDIDSAVECFLDASSRYPWALRKIFVQENAVERFTTTMTWKEEKQMEATSAGNNKSDSDREISYFFGDKTFLMRPGRDSTEHDNNVIILEAFRTVKELIGLLAKEKPFALSIWCSDVSETNELAHNVDASIVWVNDLANFEGPPRSSQAFFSLIDIYFSSQHIEQLPEIAELTKLKQSWLGLSVDQRKAVVRDALTKIDRNQSKKMLEVLDDLNSELDSFVHLTKNVIATGIELQPQVMMPSAMYDYGLESSIISYIIKGGALLLHIPPRDLPVKSKDISYMFYDNLRNMAGPVIFLDKEYKIGDIAIIRHPIKRFKVIWTNFGTIFAN
ncbi:unnamed protein product [Danaus chrysippus]|uniref:(African queen) hypothetical protein n=1 Tax=Danaus chrysippus TaxID=151541 RepID=A0A8J2QML9_9NEOP|nr:unnamed protein product [Danaus chrysippus]